MYFDSLKGRGYKPNVAVARDAQRGLFKFFQYDQPGRYVMDKAECSSGVDMNIPKQHAHNKCSNDGGSACGPYLWAMVKDWVQYAVECHEDEARTEVSVSIELALPEDYKVRCGWDSEKIRCDLRNLIDRERRVRTYLSEPFGGTHAWFDDRATGKIGWKSMLARFGMPGTWIWDPHTLESVFKNGNVIV
jgi:hypothetical protein